MLDQWSVLDAVKHEAYMAWCVLDKLRWEQGGWSLVLIVLAPLVLVSSFGWGMYEDTLDRQQRKWLED